MSDLPYREGDWIAVPLRDGTGFGVGRIARIAPGGGVLVGYFFAQRFAGRPNAERLGHLRAADAVLRCRFGDLGLLEGEWHVLGGADNWRRDEWPLPTFARKHPSGSSASGCATTCSSSGSWG